MMFKDVHIGDELVQYLASLVANCHEFAVANNKIQRQCGIVDFFPSETDLEVFKNDLTVSNEMVCEQERAEYGDFQTNAQLALSVCKLLKDKGLNPGLVVEPTFGKGNFILAALQVFDEIQTVVGVEIYEQYVWQAKFAILEFFKENLNRPKPIIHLNCQSVFQFDFSKLVGGVGEVLVLGNPPWVTNAMLSTLDSNNLPHKSNFKNHNGLDAMTGKGNFDIGEYITLMQVRAFEQCKGHIAFLVKNTVIKNLLQEQKRNCFQLSAIEQHVINSSLEFKVSVEAALLFASFGAMSAELTCQVLDFYSQAKANRYGWVGNCFVSDMDKYQAASQFDGKCPFEWRQGVKHDCSKVMELEAENGHFVNGQGEVTILEPDLVYRLLKSSDLKSPVVSLSRKFTIITQSKVGQATQYIRQQFPKTWDYLCQHETEFNNRKSSIYRDKPPFSIFGIGDYSFMPYKVAISGLYKNARFSLVLPDAGRPIMLDDTCYFIGFEKMEEAAFTAAMLNTQAVQAFLHSLVFWDSKRPFTKDLLMRLDLGKIASALPFADVSKALEELCVPLGFEQWESFRMKLVPTEVGQLSMF